ncbi:glycosyltransferase [Flavobacterium gawalongense]|uniref:Glycosyltransferase n=1 Tax=Flavobacterium gawalongense TaxID=2594432 RepID=A0ABY3CQ60_9FLAO|nr:glycosyltransferase [Flavobacterium gawalongense]
MSNTVRFIEGYSKINKPKSSSGLDIDRWTWKRKSKVFKNIEIQPVVVSSWLAEETKKSYLWKNSNPEIIHVPLKIDSWDLKNKKKCRNLLNISEDSKVIVFGAVNGLTDELKGYANLEKALLTVSRKLYTEKFILLVFGDPDIKEVNLSENLILKSIGKINDFNLINKIYCSADLVAVPSYTETFGQVAIEAISCGVPVVAFRTSGLLDIIIENFNGVLSNPYESEDMAKKIILALSLKWDYGAMRDDIDNRFGYLVTAKKYDFLYKKIINNGFV